MLLRFLLWGSTLSAALLITPLLRTPLWGIGVTGLSGSQMLVNSLDDGAAAQWVSQPESNAAVLAAIAPSKVIYLAETHNDLADHVAQLEIIEALAQKGEITIGLEMFQRPFQPVLDAYLSGDITEVELIAQSEYETRWGFDWDL